MLSRSCKYGIVISKIPVMKVGLGDIMERHFPDYELTFFHSSEELTLLQLRRAALVIVDLSGEQRQIRNICEMYYPLLSQYRDIHWVFIISRDIYPLAVEQLMRPGTTLLSDREPVEGVIKAIREGDKNVETISPMLLSSDFLEVKEPAEKLETLTHSERKVLRLLGKGWGINQIATLLKKSNKTISAQKNSAMRRLSLRSNAEMYAWINSAQGVKELNLVSAYGEYAEWKSLPEKNMLPSSRSA
ncbi:response regulator transcription factor [Metakosakonia massiliensis]|uniref:Transcription factor YjjQ n=1 Tax=Phytobacter massiliensis TaxID=1485952 RepID=A0A6N3ESQ8_9ENTR|nr:LuxR C-terminal-related transcriptional regulator [Phytobacter massiliensis]